MSEAKPTIPFTPIQASAETLLRDHFRAQVAIVRAELLSEPERRNRLWRCTLETAALSVPKTVVIKQVASDSYKPEEPDNFDTQRFFGDWAGAAFLSGSGDATLAPMFYGGDRAAGFIVLEDLGQHRSLVEPLLEGDRADATDALVRFAQLLGHVHAYGYGREDQFDAIRRDLNPALIQDTAAEQDKQNKDIDAKIADITQDWGVPMSALAQDEARQVMMAVYRPTLFRTLIHNDPCPDNVFNNTSALRLIDFEFVRYGHALKDALYGRIPFPTCWCCNRVAPDVVMEMERVYRAAFGAVCPAVLDDALYDAEVANVAAFWALRSLDVHKTALKEDGRWGIAGIRTRIRTQGSTAIAACTQARRWPNLLAFFAQLQTQMAQAWPDVVDLPVYPAFRRDEPA